MTKRSTVPTIVLINGPNMNMLGIREPERYGSVTLSQLENHLIHVAHELGLHLETFQSNSEAAIIEKIHDAYFGRKAGILINAAAYTHTSVAIGDALKAVNLPCVEIHMTNTEEREIYRHVSFVREAADAVFQGEGVQSYEKGLQYLANYLEASGAAIPRGYAS